MSIALWHSERKAIAKRKRELQEELQQLCLRDPILQYNLEHPIISYLCAYLPLPVINIILLYNTMDYCTTCERWHPKERCWTFVNMCALDHIFKVFYYEFLSRFYVIDWRFEDINEDELWNFVRQEIVAHVGLRQMKGKSLHILAPPITMRITGNHPGPAIEFFQTGDVNEEPKCSWYAI